MNRFLQASEVSTGGVGAGNKYDIPSRLKWQYAQDFPQPTLHPISHHRPTYPPTNGEAVPGKGKLIRQSLHHH